MAMGVGRYFELCFPFILLSIHVQFWTTKETTQGMVSWVTGAPSWFSCTCSYDSASSKDR